MKGGDHFSMGKYALGEQNQGLTGAVKRWFPLSKF